jgi:hypothetical protein
MSELTQSEIEENPKELEVLLQEKSSRVKERLQALYLLKAG